MAFSIPSIKDLAQRARASFKSELTGSDPWLWPSTLHVIAKVFAGITFSIFGRLAEIDRDRFAYSAQGEAIVRHGVEFGITRKPASYASGTLSVVGTANQTIVAGTVFTRSDGVTYTSSVDTTIGTDGTAALVVVSTITGPTTNVVYGTSLTTTNPNVTTATVDANGLGGGASQESYESLRARILYRKRNPPQGGAATDYVIWATAVAGVTRAYVDTTACAAGLVIIYPLMDDTYASTNGIPQPVDIARIQAYIDTQKPATATAIVAAPTPYPLAVTVRNLTPDTTLIRQAAADEIAKVIKQKGVVSTSSGGVKIYLSYIWQAVASVAGEQHFSIDAPTSDTAVPHGSIPYVSAVNFTTG